MPGTTDTRIVQMQFDNRNFERNIATSEKSLDKFKNKLDFSKCEKGLASFEKMTRGLSFDAMADNLQKLTDKFTGLGTVSELILSQIRRGIEQTAQKVSHFVNSLGFEQVEAGLEKFAQMNKNVQTIMSATGRSEEEVYKVLGRLNEYTDQTSYNFTDMAANIGKFTSVGIKLEDAEKQMEGIANWAARSGAGITEASRAMYNLSQAMGVGKMTLIDWKSIENAGMATKEFKQQMIAAGLATGTLVSETNKAGETVYKTAKQFGKQMEVNFQNMGSTLSKGWANAEVIQKTLMDYYYEDLYYESEAVLDLTKDQLEKTKKLFEDQKLDAEDWKDLDSMGIMSDEVKQKAIDAAVKMNNLVKETTKDGKTIYKTAAKYGKQIEVSVDTIEKSLSVGWLDQSVARQIGLLENLGKSSYEAAQKCTTLKDVLGAWKDQLSTGWMKAWQYVFGGLSESMDIFSAICNKVGDAFTSMMGALNGYDNDAGEHITGILESWASLGGRTNLWSMFIGEYDGLYEGAYGILDVIHDVGDMISDAFWDVMSIFVGEDRKGIFKTDPKARNAWIGIQLNNITESVKNFIASIKDFFSEVPEGATQSRFQTIQDIVKGIFSAFAIGYKVVRDLIDFFIGVGAQLTASFDSIIGLFGTFGINLKDAAQNMQQKDGLKQTLSEILEIIKPLTTAFNGFVKSVVNLVKMFIETGKESGSFASFFTAISDALKRFFSVITKIGAPIFNFLSALMGAFGDLYKNGFNAESLKVFAQNVKNAFKTMLDSIISFIPNFSATMGGLWKSFKNFFTSGFSAESFNDLKSRIKDIFEKMKAAVPKGVKDFIKTAISTVKTGIKNMVAKITPVFNKITGKVREIFESIKRVFKEGFSSGSINDLKNKLSGSLKTVADGIPQGLKDGVQKALQKIRDILGNLWSTISGFLKNIFLKKEQTEPVAEQISDTVTAAVGNGSAVGKAVNAVSGFSEKISSVVGIVTKIKNKIKELFAANKSGIVTFGQDFMRVLTDIFHFFGVYNLSDLALLIIGILGVVGLVKAVKTITKTIVAISDAIRTIGNLAKNGIMGLVTGEEERKVEDFGTKMLKMAFAIAILVAAVKVLADMEAGKGWSGIFMLAAIMGALVLFAFAVKKAYKDADPDETKSAILSMIVIAIATKMLVKALLPLSKVDFGQFAQMFGGLIMIFLYMWGINKIAKGGTFDIRNMAGFLALAAGIAILIFGLKQIQNANLTQLVMMFGTLTVILGLLFGFSKLVNKFGASMDGSGMKELAFLALSVAILVLSLLPIALLPLPLLGKALGAVAVILLMLVGFVKLTKNMTMDGAKMIELLAVAGTIILLVMALIPLALIPVVLLIKGLVGLAVIMALLKSFIKSTQNMTMSGSAMAQLIAVAGSIMLIVLSLLPLALVNWEQLGRMGAGLVVIMGALITFVKMTNGIKMAKSGMVGLLAVAGAIALIVLALIPIAIAPWPEFVRMMVGLVVIFAGLILIAKTIKGMDFKSMSGGFATILAIAGLIVVFGIMLQSVKDVNWGVILAFSVGIGLMVVLIAQAVKTLEHVNFLSAIKVIGVLAIGIAAFMGVVSLMAPMLLGSIGSSLQTLGARLSLAAGMFSDFVAEMKTFTLEDVMEANKKIDAFFELIKSIQDSSLYTTAIHDFGECLLLIGAGISQFWFSVSDVPPPEEMPALRSIRAILALGNDLAKFTIGNAAESFLRLGTGLKLFNNATSAITVTGDIPAIKMAEALVGLKDSLTGFSVGNAPTEIFTLGVGLGLFTSAASGITTDEPIAFKLLKNLADQADNLEKLTQLPLNTFKEQLSGLGGALSIYAEGAQEATGLKIGEDGSGVPDVSGALKLLHALTDGIANDPQGFKIPDMPDEGSLEGYGADLAALATALKKFSDSAKDMNPVSNMLALNALSFMAGIQEKLTENAVKKFKVFGDAGVGFATLAGFGLDIAALGTSLNSYNTSVKDFKENAAATDILDFMLSLQNKLTISALLGLKVFDNTGVHGGENGVLNRFGVDIAALGESLAAYNTSVADFKENKNAENALEFFRSLKEKLTPTDLQNAFVFDKAKVDNDVLAQFGLDISALGEALAGFATNVNFDDEKSEKFDAAIAALDRVQNIGSRLPKIGGLISLFSGHQQTLDDLAGYIKSIGESFAQMSTDLSGDADKGIKAFDLKLVSEAFGALQSLADIVSTLSIKHVATGSFFNPVDYLADLKTALDFMVGNFNGKENDVITSLMNFMSTYRDAANKIGGFSDKDMNIFEAFRNMVTGLNQLVNIDPSYDFKKVGENIMAGIEEGMKGREEALVEAVKQTLTSVLATMKELTNPDYLLVTSDYAAYDFKPLGRNLATGIAKGIKDGSGTALTEIEQLILDLKAKAYETADSNSPSLVFAELGGYIAQGLALGVNQKADEPKKAAGNMVKGMIERTDNALASLSYLLANGVDSDPTITPVLDLSNVRSGMAELNKDFGNRNLGMDLTGVARIVGNSAVNLTAGQVSANSTPDLTGVYDRMTILGNQIVEMGNQIQKMQIVLDSGVLVGGVTNGVDANIGRKTFYATRRN